MTSSSPSSSTLLERQKTTQRYPEAKVIVLDDDVNTFQHVVDCLRKIIPAWMKRRPGGWPIALMVKGSAEVWRGPLEQAELYHLQLQTEGLTMAPLDRC
jgi:ATP-dependent Clp protease adaptor protein ClpS